jgi:hypothetical protein
MIVCGMWCVARGLCGVVDLGLGWCVVLPYCKVQGVLRVRYGVVM